ncbi:MAG: hypothetical protein OEY01_10865 [Desulfobulbaceae bacterium]|nr:hypothetical protein [Desulfobulbaceae bacterium]
MTAWLGILRQHVDAKGAAATAKEVGISPASISLVLSGNYGASTDNIERKVMAVYGSESGLIDCPELGEIEPGKCAETWQRAKKVGLRCGNPATQRLHAACKRCAVRR